MSRKKSSKQTFFSPLGLRVGEVEEDSGLQRKDFAKKLGFTPAYLAQLIKGQRKNPSVRFLGDLDTGGLMDGKRDLFGPFFIQDPVVESINQASSQTNMNVSKNESEDALPDPFNI